MKAGIKRDYDLTLYLATSPTGETGVGLRLVYGKKDEVNIFLGREEVDELRQLFLEVAFDLARRDG